jgi:Hint domain
MSTTLFDSITGDSEIGAAGVSDDLSASFSTGAGSVVLTDVKIGLYDSTPSDGGSMTVVLESDSSTSPGTTIATLGTILDSSLNSNVNTFSTVNVSIESGPTLAASTRYWIGLVPISSSAGWVAGGSTSGTGVSSEYVHGDYPSFLPPFTPTPATYANSSTGTPYEMQVNGAAACFRAGTPILTTTGPVAVENLRVGTDVRLASGGIAPVVWLGHRRVDCRRHPRPWDVWPVRVGANAFGPDSPRHDVFLSPDHAAFIDGVLIPVRYLLNGATICQQEADEVTYWHVELARHDVLLADGLPCETYLDTGNRDVFENGAAALRLVPEFSRGADALGVWQTAACAPLVRDGAELEAARSVLAEQAMTLGYRLTRAPDLQVIAGGRRIDPTLRDGWLRFVLPEGLHDVRLSSRSAAPAHVRADSRDHRVLGVAVRRLMLDQRAVPLDDDAFGAGWHPVERSAWGRAWRWTNGCASLAVHGARSLELDLAMTMPYWVVTGEQVPRDHDREPPAREVVHAGAARNGAAA